MLKSNKDKRKIVGNYIRFYRKQNNISAKKLARQLGLGIATYYQVEQGKSGRVADKAYFIHLYAQALGQESSTKFLQQLNCLRSGEIVNWKGFRIKSIGSFLNELRRAKCLSREQLAEEIHVSKFQVSFEENEYHRSIVGSALEIIYRWSDLLGAETDTFPVQIVNVFSMEGLFDGRNNGL